MLAFSPILRLPLHPSPPPQLSNAPSKWTCSTKRTSTPATLPAQTPHNTYDIITIGSGLGGLCTSALLSTHTLKTVTLEAHTRPGGAAHSFTRSTNAHTFTFESGPHLFSGLSGTSNNPMRHILAACNAHVDIRTYETWGVFLPHRYVVTKVTSGGEEIFLERLMRVAGGAHAVDEMKRLVDRMCKVGHAATAIPPAALRGGDRLGTLRVMTRYMLRTDVWKSLRYVGELSKPFSEILDEVVTDGFARDFVNLLCFLLAGVTAERIPTAEIAFMFREWTGDAEVETGVLQRPRGGASGLANGLMGVIEREGGVVRTGAEVDHVIVEDGCAKGVVLRSGEALFARRAVISNVSALDVRKLLPGWKGEDEKGEMCESFMHLHMAIRLSDEVMRHVAESGLQANYVVVDDWALGVERAGNVVLVSMPSVIDESVCPAGYAVLHAYTPATEPYSLWEGVKRGSAQYKKLKRERARPLWKAVGKIFGRDMEGRGEVEFCSVGSPLTHARYLRRARGSYGPKVDARRGLGLGLPFPGQGDWPRGFWCVGDGVFPGVGVPGVAGSAWIVANGCVDVEDQVRMLDDIGL